MQIGEHVKIHLRGEAPWVHVTAIPSNDQLVGKIDNHLINTDEHGWKYGDVITIERDHEKGGWTPARRQLPIITWFGKGEPDCEDCLDGYCTLNCGPRVTVNKPNTETGHD